MLWELDRGGLTHSGLSEQRHSAPCGWETEWVGEFGPEKDMDRKTEVESATEVVQTSSSWYKNIHKSTEMERLPGYCTKI